MSTCDKELEKRLLEAAKYFPHPPHPTSVEKLLHLLHKLFICLSEVEQSPSSSIQNALSPLTKALVHERLFKHSNVDVRVAVASCITEVTRINAPVAPYVDDKMREVLQLIVSSFEDLDNKHSISYTKRTSILNTVAKCQVSVLMLDPVYDALRIEMFHHFLRALRDHHPIEVFSNMENIMTHVLKESDDIPPEVLAPILYYAKKDDEVPPISKRLAEKVLMNCSSKCKTYLAEAVKSSGVPLDKYSNVVALICQGPFSVLKQNKVEDKQKVLLKLSTHEQTKDKICKSRVSNGVALSDSSVDTDSTKKQYDVNGEDKPQQLDNSINSGLDDSTIDEISGRPVKAVKQKEKESSTKEAKPSAASATKATPEDINTSEAKLTKESGKKIAFSSKAKPSVPPTKKRTSGIKQSEKPISLGDNKKPVVSSGMSVSKSKTEVKQPLEKTATNTNSKRKHSLGTEKASDLREYDENLVGLRIRVWWPFYKRYYEGEVSSYDSSTKKHLVMYDDGDQETLNLKKQKWYIVDESESSQDKHKAVEVSKPEQTGAPKSRLNLSLPHEEDSAETETPTNKRARVQKAHGEMEAEGEPSCPNHKSSPEFEDSQPCSVTHQLAKVKQSIVDTITSVRQFGSEVETKEQSIVDMLTSVRQFRSELETKEQSIVDTLTNVRQFRSEIKIKEDNLVATLLEVDVLGEKISGINKILNS